MGSKTEGQCSYTGFTQVHEHIVPLKQIFNSQTASYSAFKKLKMLFEPVPRLRVAVTTVKMRGSQKKKEVRWTNYQCFSFTRTKKLSHPIPDSWKVKPSRDAHN